MAQVEFASYLGDVLHATDEALKQAAEIIGGMAESHAKQLCPVDTGNLRGSITHSTERNGHTVVIGTAVKYAPYVELGTGIYAEKGGRPTPWKYHDKKGWHTTSGSPPQPFLRPAIEDYKDDYREVLKQVLSGK